MIVPPLALVATIDELFVIDAQAQEQERVRREAVASLSGQRQD